MTTEQRIIIHVGIHKTGTTSIQQFLFRNRMSLRALDVDFYSGIHFPSNHVELHAAAMRLERASPFKLYGDVIVDETYREQVQSHIRRYIAQSPCRNVVFSAEGLSYLRYEDEMNRLKAMIPGRHTEIVMYLRSPASFLASYKRTMKTFELPAEIEKDHFAYTEVDSWLVDFENRLAGFRNAFGARNVTTVCYEAELSISGNVIPSFLEILGVAHHFPPRYWQPVFENRASTA